MTFTVQNKNLELISDFINDFRSKVYYTLLISGLNFLNRMT